MKNYTGIKFISHHISCEDIASENIVPEYTLLLIELIESHNGNLDYLLNEEKIEEIKKAIFQLENREIIYFGYHWGDFKDNRFIEIGEREVLFENNDVSSYDIKKVEKQDYKYGKHINFHTYLLQEEKNDFRKTNMPDPNSLSYLRISEFNAFAFNHKRSFEGFAKTISPKDTLIIRQERARVDYENGLLECDTIRPSGNERPSYSKVLCEFYKNKKS